MNPSRKWLVSWIWTAVVGWVGVSWAAEPIPDWITLVFPTLVPKAGHTNVVPANLARSFIEYAYSTRYENYWKEVSYYINDPATGQKIQGAYGDTKTYGFIQMPWPLRSRASRGTFARGTGRGDLFNAPTDEGRNADAAVNLPSGEVGSPNRRYSTAAFNSPFYFWAYDGADEDGVWTPGESFQDLNTNGVWDPPQPAEDFWDSDNIVSFIGEPQAYNPRNQNGIWSQYGGEMFADYNDNGGYNRVLNIYVAVGGNQVLIAGHNELDLSPDPGTPGSNEGDFTHVIVTNTAIPMPYPINPYPIPGSLPDGTTIPPNGYLDATTDADGNLQVIDTGLYIEYYAYCYSNQTAAARGYFTWADVVKAAGPPPANAYPTPRPVRARLYACRELYGTYKSATATPANGIRVYGDLRNPVAAQRPAYPTRRITNSEDGRWTAAVNGEPFEDFLAIYDPARGATAFVQCPPALLANCSVERGNRLANGSINTRGRSISFTYDFYTNYIAWNYPGNWTALVARAFNGRYDGPDDWTDQGVSGKWVWDERAQPVAATGAPVPGTVDADGRLLWSSSAPGGGWDPRSGFATWGDWYRSVFGIGITPPPAFSPGVTRVTRYTPNSGRADNGWIPATSWGYDSPAEYCDLPSSIYHLGGSYAAGTTFLGGFDPFLEYHATNTLYMYGGDRKLGEVTSPWNEEIWGHDIEGIANFYGPGDGFIPAAGPYAFNTLAGHGYDGANQMTTEFLTHRRIGVPGVDQHPRVFRDTNCDGYLDGGRELQGEANYSSDHQGIANIGYPFSWYRYVEDVIALWDQAEDFVSLEERTFGPGSAGLGLYAYPIYPVSPGHEGWAALGGPSGQSVTVISRDRAGTISFMFQVRPLNGSGEMPQIRPDGAWDPNWDPNQDPPVQDFGMALLSHEQGHDYMGWPDLYDYDVWSGGQPIINRPIGAYDLMSSSAMVHGIPDLKLIAGVGGPWINIQDLESLLPLDGGPVTLDLYPIERHNDAYFYVRHPDRFELLWFWFTDNNTDYPVVGGRGVYVSHSDYTDMEAGVPIQQKVNNHFTWEMLQADGRSDLQDGLNSGDAGDAFPGTRNLRVFSEDTQPAARWWDTNPVGIRITNIELPPPGSGLPARVTFERFSLTTNWYVGRNGADTDADGIPDAWEFRYFGNLTTATSTSDYDHDGLSDRGEFLAGTNPTMQDTDGDGMLDQFEDSDGDGISNRDEMVVYGTDPGRADTDDDGFSDLYEITQVVFNPLDSLSPYVPRALRFFGLPGSYLQVPTEDPERRFQTGDLTVEAWISPTADTLGNGGTVYRRTWSSGVSQELVLGLTTDARPFAWYNTGYAVISVTNSTPVPLEPLGPTSMFVTNWTHVALSYEHATRTLRLWVNGASVGTVFNPTASGLTNAASLVQRVGEGFRGLIDEVHIWNEARPPSLMGLSGAETRLAAYYKFDDFTSSSPGPDNLWGTADDIRVDKGYVEDFTRPREWTNGWVHAAWLVGRVTWYTNRFLHFPILGSDTDMDGMPDTYENMFPAVLDPMVADSHLDPDGDGWISEWEFLASALPNGAFTNVPSPASSATYPVPWIHSYFKSSIGTNPAGQMVIWAYSTNRMDGPPNAVIVVPGAQVPAVHPFTLNTQGYSAGALRGGPTWFLAFKDLNNNENWDPGEPLSLAEGGVVESTWSDVNLTFHLMTQRPGFWRFAWPAQPTNQFRVIVRDGAGRWVIDRYVNDRNFFHEGDYIAAGYSNGLSGASTYQYFVYRAWETPFAVPALASGSFAMPYLSVPPAPASVTADGTVWRSTVNWLEVRFHTNSVRYELVVRDAASNIVYQALDLMPAADADGIHRLRVPIYDSGTYTWQARGLNGYGAGPWSPARTLVVNLNPSPVGPYEISGEVFYQGKVLNPVVTVEAFAQRDLGGLPWARARVQKVSVTNEGVAGRVAFTLRGLPAGTYYVRAYMDQNNNGRLDPWESRGMIASRSAPYYATALTVPANRSGQVLVLHDRDTDNDSLPDAWEYYLVGTLSRMGRGPVRGWTDTDGDGLNDLEEYLESAVDSNPLVADTDGDGINDGDEVLMFGTNPRLADTDGDGLTDGVERQLGTNPLLRDTDGDGVPDGLEVQRGSNPLAHDTDGDGYPDILEVAAGTHPADRNSVPGCNQLLEIASLKRDGTLLQTRLRLAHGIQRLAEHIEVWVETATSLQGPWTPVEASPVAVAPTSDPDAVQAVQTGAGDTSGQVRYYRLRWRLKD